MIRDLLQFRPDPHVVPDVCIVGAGAAGIMLAVELAGLGRTVTLLEGGGAAIEESAQTPYESECAALPHRGLHGGRFRALGGTTTMWGGQILKLQESDFERRAWIPESGWPISTHDLEPHYERALELEGLRNVIRSDRDVWKALGKAGPPDSGDFTSYLSRWCPEPNFARLHRRSLEHDARIDTWLHAHAVELLLEDGTARGVRCRTSEGKETIFRAKTYVFALGAIESSRFFLQPRDNGGLPWNDSGLLGRHFQDHIDSDAAEVTPLDARAFRDAFDTIFLSGHRYTPKLTLSAARQRADRLLNVGATVYSAADENDALTPLKSNAKKLLKGELREVKVKEVWPMMRHAPTLLAGAYRYAVEHRAFHPASAKFRLRVHCEQEPTSASTITLSPLRDAFGLRKTALAWKISPLEIQTIRRLVELAQSSLEGVGRVIPHPALFDQDDAFIGYCQDSFHHMGGMRMHRLPTLGVVDTDLRLHGVRNCFVCSSAVFPTSGFSNPTHTLLALSVRLAHHLLNETTSYLQESEERRSEAVDDALPNPERPAACFVAPP